MPISKKRKVHFAKDAKTHDMKKLKLDGNLANNSSSDSESEDETFKNKISSKKKKVSKVTEKLKTPDKKKVSQVQKYTSSSESESANEIAKNKTGPKGKNILKVPEVQKTSKSSSLELESEDKMPETTTSLKKQELLKNGSLKKCFDFSSSLTKDKPLSGSKNSKKSSGKNLELTRSDSDEPPLVIDEDGDNDLVGLKKYMTDELKLNVSSPAKAKLNHDAPQSMPDKNSNNDGSSSESESDIEGTQETKKANNCRQIKKNINQKLNNTSSESESDSEKIEKRDYKEGEETNINLNGQSNLNTSETKFDEEETQKALKSEFHSPSINYDLQMLSKAKKGNDSENSDFELTLESGASHEEKEAASSGNDSKKSKAFSDTIKRTSASRKKKPSFSKKAPSPVDERMRDSDDSAPENKLTLENGTLQEEKELASTDTDSKKEAVVNGKLKRTRKKTCIPPKKSPLPVASENSSLHKDEDQASSDIDAKKSKTNKKLESASDSKKTKLNSPEKAPDLPAPATPAVAVPKSEEDEVSSDNSADEEEDLNETLLHSAEPTYRPTVEEKRRLASIEILMKHEVLPQHQVESTAGTRTLKQREKAEFEKYATLKRGTFDITEDKQIKKNWKIFCKNNDWNPKNPKPFLFMKLKNKEALMSQVNRKKFMQILAHGLPNRSLYSVFQRFKNLYDPHRKCRYTEDEDRAIVYFISNYNAVDEKDRKFAELATILKRTRASVWRRYRVLKKKQLLRLDDSLCHGSR